LFSFFFSTFVLSKYIGDSDDTGHEPKRICSRTNFYLYSRKHHSKVVLRKPSKDICGICFKYNLYYRQRVQEKKKEEEERVRNGIIFGDDDEYEYNDDNDNNNGNDIDCQPCSIPEEVDQQFLEVTEHIKEAQSMRDLFHELEIEAKQNSPEIVKVEQVCLVIIIDYAQNLETPSFREDQPVRIA